MSFNLAQSLLLFIPLLLLCGGLVSSRHLFGFLKTYQSQFEDDQTIAPYVQKAADLWRARGYHELNAFVQVLLDALTLGAGYAFCANLLGLFWPHSVTTTFFSIITSSVLVFGIAHWLIPLLAQSLLPKSLIPVTVTYSIFWVLFGWVGDLIDIASQALLQNAGFYRKYKTIPENDLGKAPSAQTGLEEDEAEMVQNIFNIGNTTVKEIFTPRVDILGLEIHTPYHEVIRFIKSHRYTRVPVYQDSLDDIHGILHIKDLLLLTEQERMENFSLAKVARPAYFIPRSKKVDDLMTEFKVGHIHMAIVVDEYGGTAGLITLEDILEEIVGEIQDEDDTEPPKVTHVGDKIYIIDPIILLEDLNREISIALRPEEDIEIDTLGGYLQYLKGSVPSEGEIIKTNEYHFEILKMDGQSIEKVRLTCTESA